VFSHAEVIAFDLLFDLRKAFPSLMLSPDDVKGLCLVLGVTASSNPLIQNIIDTNVINKSGIVPNSTRQKIICQNAFLSERFVTLHLSKQFMFLHMLMSGTPSDWWRLLPWSCVKQKS
jgi:hypothetical protein